MIDPADLMLTRFLFWMYSGVVAVGFLRTTLGRRGFGYAYFLYKRYWEDELAALIAVHPELFRGGDVLDVGANIGYTASLFEGAVDPGCVVHAFEPEPRNFESLSWLAGKSKVAGRILPVHAAVGREPGVIFLSLNDLHPGDHRVLTSTFQNNSQGESRLEVPIVSLDRYVAGLRPVPRVAFVKIDVQGYELAVCQGMEQLIAGNPEITIVLEYMPQAMKDLGFVAGDLLDWLHSRGFYIYQLGKKGTLLMVTDEVMLGLRGYEDILCRKVPI